MLGVPPDDDSRDLLPRAPREYGGWFAGLRGAETKYKAYPVPKSDKRYFNWHLKCNKHASCTSFKTKGSMGTLSSRDAAVEHLGFLHTWLELHPAKAPGISSGANWNPPRANVAAFIEANQEALRALVDMGFDA